MAGERNLGRGRAIRSRVTDKTPSFREMYPDPWRVPRRSDVPGGKPAGRVRKAATPRPSRPASVRFKITPTVNWDNIGKPVKERAAKLGRVRQARTSAANLGRAANFTGPRGSRGGQKYHGR